MRSCLSSSCDPNLWRHNRCKFDEINHKSTLNVGEIALDNGVSQVMYVSTESILASDEFHRGAVELAWSIEPLSYLLRIPIDFYCGLLDL